MNDKEYDFYEALAEHIAFLGITQEQLLQVAKYRKDKSLKDVREAMKQGRTEGLGHGGLELTCMVNNLFEVVEIDTSQPFLQYHAKLIQSKKA